MSIRYRISGQFLYEPEKYGPRASSIMIRIRDEIIDVICVRPPEAF